MLLEQTGEFMVHIYVSSIHIEYDNTHDWWTCLPHEFRSFLRFTNINFHQAFAPWCCIWLAMYSDKRELLHCVMFVAYVPPWYALSSTTHHMHTCRAINICDEFDEDFFLWNNRMKKCAHDLVGYVIVIDDWTIEGSTWKLRCYEWKVMCFVFSKWNW